MSAFVRNPSWRAVAGVLGGLVVVLGMGCGGGGGGRGFPLTAAAVFASDPDPYFSGQISPYATADGTLVPGDVMSVGDDDDFALWDVIAGTFLADPMQITAEAVTEGVISASPQAFDTRTFQAYYETPCSGGTGTFVWHGVIEAISSMGGAWDFALFKSVDVTFSGCLFTGPPDTLGQTGGASPLITLNGRLAASQQVIDNFPDVTYNDRLSGSVTVTSGTNTWVSSTKSITASALSCTSTATGCANAMSGAVDGGLCVGGNVVRNHNETDMDDGCSAGADPGAFMGATMPWFDIFLNVFGI